MSDQEHGPDPVGAAIFLVAMAVVYIGIGYMVGAHAAKQKAPTSQDQKINIGPASSSGEAPTRDAEPADKAQWPCRDRDCIRVDGRQIDVSAQEPPAPGAGMDLSESGQPVGSRTRGLVFS